MLKKPAFDINVFLGYTDVTPQVKLCSLFSYVQYSGKHGPPEQTTAFTGISTSSKVSILKDLDTTKFKLRLNELTIINPVNSTRGGCRCALKRIIG